MNESTPTDETAGVLGDDATADQLQAAAEVPALATPAEDAQVAAMLAGVSALLLTCGELGDTDATTLPIFISPDHPAEHLAADLAAAVEALGFSPPRSAAADVPWHLAATWTSRGARVVHEPRTTPDATPDE